MFEHLAVRGVPAMFAFHPANGGWRSRVEAAILKGMGVRAGVPDIIAVKGGRGHALELKAPGGHLTLLSSATPMRRSSRPARRLRRLPASMRRAERCLKAGTCCAEVRVMDETAKPLTQRASGCRTGASTSSWTSSMAASGNRWHRPLRGGRLAEVFFNVAKSGTAIENHARDAAVVASVALQYGTPVDVIRHAVTRNGDGRLPARSALCSIRWASETGP